jgi:aminoglycoside phosphotransferase (APT) family kinase protein
VITALHADERIAQPADVHRLLAAQAPALAGQRVTPLAKTGTDNVAYRIGDSAIGRFPRTASAAQSVRREATWLPHLPPLPLRVPRVLAAGEPDAGYPFPWIVLDWLPGHDATPTPPGAAAALAAFVATLHAHPVPPGLPAAPPGRLSAGALAFARQMAAAFTPDEGDPHQINALLDRAEALPPPATDPVWTHGDLHGANLLAQDGRLSAVIDWGSLGAGDPARDLICAWTMLDPAGRDAFRAALSPDPAAWDRARAFALVMAVQAIPYYRTTNPAFSRARRETLAQVLSDLA